jgi:hypothetical protein
MIRTLLALALMASPALAGNPQFQTPTGNIGCEYQPHAGNRLYCVRLKPSIDYIVLDVDGGTSGPFEGDLWISDSAPVLAYGQTRKLGPYTCESKTSGLVCQAGERGFSANMRGIRLFSFQLAGLIGGNWR